MARFKIALHIFAENVALEIYPVTGFAVAKVSVPVGIRNYGDFRDTRAVIPSRDGEADAVDGDRAFRNDVARKILGNFHSEPPVVTFGRQINHSADSIDVTEYEVTAKFLKRSHCSFEVYERSLFEGAFDAKGCFSDGLPGKIGRKTIVIRLDYREAAPIYSNAIGFAEVSNNAQRLDGHASTVAFQFECFDCANMFDDSGKQG